MIMVFLGLMSHQMRRLPCICSSTFCSSLKLENASCICGGDADDSMRMCWHL